MNVCCSIPNLYVYSLSRAIIVAHVSCMSQLEVLQLAELALSKLEFLEVSKKGLSKLQILLIELEVGMVYFYFSICYTRSFIKTRAACELLGCFVFLPKHTITPGCFSK